MPRISVIVPIYDVEPYLSACLESVAAQTWQDVEVVMVDDGSPDASARIAARFAARDGRFRLLRQDNGGLGAARNTGIRHATGEFLMFLDSDDLLPVHALEYLLASLQRTGSDIAVGNVLRYDGRRTRPSALHREIAARPGAHSHITRNRALLRDRLVTNKLWRRAFWDARSLAFPEGVLYEDIGVALRAHFLARAVDVLPAPVYVWRERTAGSRSITQDQTGPAHLEDRFAAVNGVRDFLTEHHLTAHIHGWDRVVLESDLTNFLDVLDRAAEPFRERFLDLANAYLDDVALPVRDALPALRRVEWHLVRERRLGDLLRVVAWDREVAPERRLVRRLWRYHLDVPVSRGRGAALPAALTRVREELDPRHRVDAVRWENGRLTVEGRAAPAFLRPARRFHQRVFAALVHERSGRRLRVRAVTTRARVRAGSGGEHDWGGFRVEIDPALVARPGRLGRWHVELGVVHRGFLRRGRIADGRATWVARAGGRAVGPDHYAAPLLSETGDLVVRASRQAARVLTQSVRDGRLRLVGHVVTDLGPEPVLQLVRRPGGVPLGFPVEVDRRTFEATVDLRRVLPARRPEPAACPDDVHLLDAPAEWTVEVRAADGTATAVTAVDDLPPGRYAVEDREIVVLRERSGCLVLRDQPVSAYADLTEWLPGGELLLEGGFAVPHAPSALVVTSLDRQDERLAPIEAVGARFRARLAPEEVDSPAGPLPLPRGRYALSVRVLGGAEDLPVELDGDGPAAHETARRTFELGTDEAGRAVLTVGGDLGANERGRKAQRELRTIAYPKMRERPLRDAVFLSGGGGTRLGASPKAIHEELRRRGADLEFLWHVRDGQVALPGGADAVRSLGREHYEALARCRLVVADGPLPSWFVRRHGQVVVQTWHGPPDDPAGRDERERLAEGAREWTHLVSAGPWWTERLRATFPFGGEVLETGLPGDDLLCRPSPGAVAGTRRGLGVAPGRVTVLYVPGDGPSLDLGRLREALPQDHEILVWRPRGPRPGPSPVRPRAVRGVRDVSAHPDLHGLYLVADVLVTGHGEAAFEFPVTGRPVLLHSADDRPPHPEAPGPLLRSADEVAEAVRDLAEVAEKHTGLREAFLARFRPLADGRAAARLVDALFG
ncbi:CDP-glycerol glycerophosphotransferase family protein [Microbispora sp. RL4-1S]|uniref:CDP-glycerol glycerophosphotransferase family protein n=1 Tax=Microbispora oryzae TaxID=2806554 RepID=A0A941AI46_9ACTN|nr:CDP-glycerol glycerophosphotransferase family protein [Microbispora oryzae]MBP2704800.1 CDP-glycerol glycerophosphotransferase family protein [Microbispora oryzae]